MDGAGRLYIKTLQELSIRDKEGNVLNTIDISQANLTTENIVHAFGNERRFILQGNNGLTDVRW